MERKEKKSVERETDILPAGQYIAFAICVTYTLHCYSFYQRICLYLPTQTRSFNNILRANLLQCLHIVLGIRANVEKAVFQMNEAAR